MATGATPDERGLVRDVRAAHQFLVEEAGFSDEHLLLYGESLGAAVVTELATEQSPTGVVPRSPFVDLASVGRVHYPFLPVRTLLRDKYPLADRLAAVTVPVAVICGGRLRRAAGAKPDRGARGSCAAAPGRG